MSATALKMPELEPRTATHRTVSPELRETILEVAASERALDDLIGYANRLHRSNIQHDPQSCLVCFGVS